MAHKMLENLRQKLLGRLDSLNKMRGQFQEANAFREFRNAASAQKGQPVDYERFRRAVQQFDCPGNRNDKLMRRAFGLLSRQDGKADSNDKAITFGHVR